MMHGSAIMERANLTAGLAFGLMLAAGLGFAVTAGPARAAGPAVPPPAAALQPVTPDAPAPVVTALAAHRASYKVTLWKSTGTKSPTAAGGRVDYEFSGSACEGYSQNFRQITELQPAEGATRLSDMRSATFEDGDARSFSFDVTTTTDNNSTDVIDGRAVKKDAALAIQISKPSREIIDVGQTVLFPTEHLEHILAAARAGQNMFSAKVFDGSDDGKKVYDTAAIIGHPLTGPAGDPAPGAKALDKIRRWPVSISYYEEDKKDEGPAYILGFELYENGVSRALRFDYGDFVLAGEMTSFDLLPSKGCAK